MYDFKSYWNQFINGENDALSFAYEDFFQPLLFTCIKQLKDPEIAKDIVSEVFISLLETPTDERIQKWKDIKNLKAFLTVIVKCRAIDHGRGVKNRSRILEELVTVKATNTKDEFIQDLYVCIERLPIEEQFLVKLHLEGYKNDEIGEKLNVTEKTVRNKLCLSRKKMSLLWKNLIVFVLWMI